MKKAKLIAQQLKKELEQYKSFVGLYLYGSWIKGTAKKDSDIDIVAIFKSKNNEYKNSILKAWDLELQNNVVIDFHPFLLKHLQKDRLYFDEIKKGIYYGRKIN